MEKTEKKSWTFGEMVEQLERGGNFSMTTADTLRSRIDREAKSVEVEKAKLFKADGTRLYRDEEHAERMQAVLKEMSRVVDEVNEAADKAAESKQEEIYRYRYSDPTDDLLPEQLEAANIRKTFVAEDCQELPLDELAKRCRGVAVQGKKELLFLYSRYGRRRAAQTLEELRDQSKPFPNRQETSARLRALEEVLKILEERVGSTFAKEQAEKAEAELQALQGVRMYATRRRMEVDGSDERYRREFVQSLWRRV